MINALYASSNFDACIPPITNTLLNRSGFAPLNISTFDGVFCRLLYFFFVEALGRDDMLEVDTVPVDLVSEVIFEMIDRLILLVVLAIRKKAMRMV